MFQRTLAGLLATPDSPTADLYFMNACGDFLRNGLRRLGPTVFASDRACLVMRHDLRAGAPGRAGPAGPGQARRLIYFIDDAVGDGACDGSLPLLYRQKLRLVEVAAERRVAARAASVVVSSAALVDRYAGRAETHLIHPYWSEPMVGTAHFDALVRGQGWIEMAYLGSAVHRADLAFLWPVIAETLTAHPRVRFHLSERHSIPAALAGHPRILPIPGRDWPDYRAALTRRRFHIALYPLMETPFNQARSINKLIEHGLVGAAPLYSRAWREAWRVGSSGGGLVLKNARDAWRAAIEDLIARPGRMRELAARAGALAESLNRPDAQRRLWTRLMEVDHDAAA